MKNYLIDVKVNDDLVQSTSVHKIISEVVTRLNRDNIDKFSFYNRESLSQVSYDHSINNLGDHKLNVNIDYRCEVTSHLF